MDRATLLAIISGAGAVVVAAVTAGLTYLLTRRREREADWRKMKLGHYREYVADLSGIVEGHATPEGHLRYVHAVNALTLVASAPVVRALYAYLDYNSYRDFEENIAKYDEFLTTLLNALRQDVYPQRRRHNDPESIRLITLPPEIRPAGPGEQ